MLPVEPVTAHGHAVPAPQRAGLLCCNRVWLLTLSPLYPASQLPASQAEEGAAGHTFTAASWSAAPAGTLRLEGVQVATLPALLAALRPPAAGPLECLLLEDAWPLESGFAAAVAAVEACAPHFQHLRELGIAASAYAAFFLMPLLRQLPRLESLQLTKCSLSDLPAGPYLSCKEACVVCGGLVCSHTFRCLLVCPHGVRITGLCLADTRPAAHASTIDICMLDKHCCPNVPTSPSLGPWLQA